MVKALGRAFRWQRLLESGQYVTTEVATAEYINTSYISRILRLTLLYSGDRRSDPGRSPANSHDTQKPSKGLSCLMGSAT